MPECEKRVRETVLSDASPFTMTYREPGGCFVGFGGGAGLWEGVSLGDGIVHVPVRLCSPKAKDAASWCSASGGSAP